MKRTIQVSLDTARQWYKSGNTALKELALSVFTKEELTFSVESLYKDIIEVEIKVSATNADVLTALDKLRLLAEYFEEKYTVKSSRGSRFFFSGMDKGEILVSTHDSVRYPGIVYFRSRQDVLLALRELSDVELEALVQQHC